METPRNRDDQLAAELRAMRPEPRPEFTAELDERAAAGFPRRSGLSGFSFPRLDSIQPRRLLVASGAVALLAIVVATAVVATSENGDENASRDQIAFSNSKPERSDAAALATQENKARAATPDVNRSSGSSSSGVQYDAYVPTVASAEENSRASSGASSSPAEAAEGLSAPVRKRAVERSAELVLGAAPGDVGEDSSEVFEVVHAHDGIVMSSSTREGRPGQARARFELLIPSAKLSDALADLSAIDEVITRHEATTDITAPTVTTGELLRDSKARIDSLLAQLEEAETESEREVVEAELRQERRHRARLRASLQDLQRRADLSRVLVRIETGASEDSSSDGGAWGIDDALGDAGKILAVAAAVTVVALAILGPIALIALLVWLTHRAWVRRERRRVLS